jgi:hypothetical protein
VSGRVGEALAAYIRTLPPKDAPKFVLVEGVPLSLAEGMAAAWDDSLPPLAVVSDAPERFGAAALEGVSGTGLRNRRTGDGATGVVLVLCEGQQVPDRQSLNLFESVAPSVLLDDAAGMALLAQQAPAVPLDGAARQVREAVILAGAASRPSAAAVAAWLDRVAAGDDPLRALPALGAFADHAHGGKVDPERIKDNLALAARRTSAELLRPSGYADVRRRAEAVLGRRPGLSAEAAGAVDDVMAAVQAGNSRLLELLTYDEAHEVLEEKAQNLLGAVLTAIADYRRGLPEGGQAWALPWDKYIRKAQGLRRAADQRGAAQELLDLDDAQKREVFPRPTRIKLERLLRDRAISGSRPSCPEAAFVRATQQLYGLIDRVEVLAPRPSPSQPDNRSSATKALTLACARLRLGGLLRRWENLGGEVDGLLLTRTDDKAVLAAFADAALTGPGDLPTLQLRLHNYKRKATVQVDWKPDLDDAALLRTVLLFAEQPTLTLRLTGAEPSLHAFTGGENPAAEPVPDALAGLAEDLQRQAETLLEYGLNPAALAAWAASWTAACDSEEASGRTDYAEALTLAGAVTGGDRTVALTPLAPLKAEWLAQYLQALWDLLDRAETPDTEAEPAAAAAAAVARTTASQHPAHLRLRSRGRPLLPTSEGRFWGLYGARHTRDESGHAGAVLTSVLERLLTLQPEAAGHLRCLAWGPGAADLLASTAVERIGRRTGRATVRKVEIFCIGRGPDDRPSPATLAAADDELRGGRDVLELRYLDSLDQALTVLPESGSGAPAVHLALVTGITEGGQLLEINSPEVAPPAPGEEVLFAPRTWQRPRQAGRTLLMPPAATAPGQAWLRLQNAVEEGWPRRGDDIRVPEVRTGTLDIAEPLRKVHDLALWVATLDRYATRDSLEQALGADQIAILHQERRLGGDSPLSLVLSQRSGGAADRAIGRSLRAAGIVSDTRVALSIGTDIRRVASQGYGILALEAATSGAGINELVGHVVAFSLLATTTTPWPLPPGCRVLLVSLDEYRHWFPGKRADLLAIALDPAERGVHIAAIEVKARRSDETDAAAGALDQLNQTLAATRWAAYPVKGSVYSRLWLNRIAEAAYSVARESRFRLDAGELAALESFRLGDGTLEWAGVGLVFGPKATEFDRDYPTQVAGDIVPVVLHSIRLTEQLLRDATAVNLTELRTVEADRPALQGGRTRRRPEAKTANPEPPPADPSPVAPGGAGTPAAQAAAAEETPATSTPPAPVVGDLGPDTPPSAAGASPTRDSPTPEAPPAGARGFVAPILGWDADTGEEVRWHPAGSSQTTLQNGHTEIWGSSGMGKTQFAMSLLAQLAAHSGSRFGIADFKNDYSSDTGFPQLTGAEFLDLWDGGAPYNPLALDAPLGGDSRVADRAVDTAVIGLRDTVEEALRNLGRRQRSKLEKALRDAYAAGRAENRWPTLRTLDDQLDDDLAGILGDLTRYDLFTAGPPLGDVIDRNVVFGLSKIPGNGQTTVLAAGFILSSLLLRVQNLPPVPNTVRYVAVVDEAHRVASFQAIKTMIREGRSKGLAVVLATQQPLDLDPVVAANAQTKICFGLPDATVATMAARKLDPNNAHLAEQIRTLGKGEAFVSLAGDTPRLLRMAQVYRDAVALGVDHG